MNSELKKIVTIALCIVCGIAVLVLFLFDGAGLRDIEDTNGTSNIELQTITDEDIVKRKYGSKNLGIRDSLIGDSVEFYSGNFTGTHEIGSIGVIMGSERFSVADYNVYDGNCKLCVVKDRKEIVHTFTPGYEGGIEDFMTEGSGNYALILAGECADFEFSMSGYEYEKIKPAGN